MSTVMIVARPDDPVVDDPDQRGQPDGAQDGCGSSRRRDTPIPAKATSQARTASRKPSC
jgi:hypothetical protein